MRISSRWRETGGDRGSLTLMLIILFVALLALAGLVIDGGAKLDAASTAAAVAQEAARAGAGEVNRPIAYNSGAFVVNPGLAVNAAEDYLAAAGYPDNSVQVIPPRTIRVTVTIIQPTKVLSLIGISTIKVTESASATLVTGVTGPGS